MEVQGLLRRRDLADIVMGGDTFLLNNEVKPKSYPRLTKEQELQFKELYLQGYSARFIFGKLGQPYNFTSQSLVSRMIYYRIKLGLPKRKAGFRPIDVQEQDMMKKKMRQVRKDKERYEGLPQKIAFAEEQIAKWKQEMKVLKKVVRNAKV